MNRNRLRDRYALYLAILREVFILFTVALETHKVATTVQFLYGALNNIWLEGCSNHQK
jgi:hypothetical protein